MKRLIIILVAGLALASCNFGGMNSPAVVRKTFNTPTDSLMMACQDLDGLGAFKLGMTWKDMTRIPDIKESWKSWHNEWSTVYGKYGVDEIGEDEKGEWFNKNVPELKRFVPNYKLGDIAFRHVVLCFYENKLVYISFEMDKLGDEVKEHYIEKYGEGQGSYYDEHTSNGAKDYDKLESYHRTDEDRRWFNEMNAMEYYYHWVSYTYPKKSGRRNWSSRKDYYEIYSIEGYELFKNRFSEANELYKSHLEKQKNSSLDLL